MKGTCPSCGFGGGIEAFRNDAQWRKAVFAAAKLPSDCGTRTLNYMAMFRPSTRNLTPERAARIICEVCAMITDGVAFDRQMIKAPSHVWRQALMEIKDADIRRPLKNHHYLLRIVQSKLAARTDADQAERHQSRRGQSHVNTGLQDVGQPLVGCRSGGQTRQGTSPCPTDPLDGVSAEDRKRWLKKAREALLADGFSPKFMAQPLIEQKAREMIIRNQLTTDERR